ncbi:MAG: endonuclease/exonuclease/phosphatase family protein [Bacteroidaceae bacterium]|nr:endonuclease/exonuclease/phosphatase family protein [Bacteroidaceae bacterium]
MIIFIAINLLTIVAMIFCAYTSYLPPQRFPHLSYFGLMFPFFLGANVVFLFFWLVFKWKVVILPAIGLLLCASSIRAYFPLNIPSSTPEGCIKVLSYNVMAFGNKNVHWNENPILNYLFDSQADIICLQEGKKTTVDDALDKLTELYPYHSMEISTDNYIACFSKYPILSTIQINYPTETNCSFVYTVAVGEDTILLINNHLESYKLSAEDKADYKSIIKNYSHPEENNSETKYLTLTEKISHRDSIRGIQADYVADFVESHQDSHIILCGDLNSSPISYPHHRLTQYLNDAYTHSGNGPGTSYNRSGMYFRLDHIMVSPDLECYQAKVDKSIKESDHYPIYCYVKISRK